MAKSKIWFAVVAIVVLSLIALPAVGCAKPVEKEQYFTIYFFADMSRIYGFINVPRLLAIQDAIDFLNGQGGIHGRKYRVKWFDHVNDLSVGATIYDRLRLNKNFIFMGVCGSQENTAFHDRYEEDEVVVSTCGVAEKGIYPAGYVFGTTPNYPNQFGLFIDWLVETWDWKGKGRGPNLAFATYDTPYGKGCLTDMTYKYAKDRGVTVVDTQYIPVVIVDAATILARAKKAGADWIYGNQLWMSLASMAKENVAGKYGLNFGTNVWAVDEALPMLGGPSTEGIVGISPYVLWSETDKPAIKLVTKIGKEKGRRTEDLTATYLLGWMNVFTIHEALDNLVPKLGWEGINGREIRRELETWGENHSIGGKYGYEFVRVAYTREYREALPARVVQIKGGTWVPITDYRLCPFIISDELKGPYVEPAKPPVPKKVF